MSPQWCVPMFDMNWIPTHIRQMHHTYRWNVLFKKTWWFFKNSNLC